MPRKPPLVIHSESTPGQFIRELHVWITTFPDGTEGIVAGNLPGMGMSPLMSSNQSVAEQLEPLARSIAGAAGVQCRLVTFVSMEGAR